jgi:hypothetical protein
MVVVRGTFAAETLMNSVGESSKLGLTNLLFFSKRITTLNLKTIFKGSDAVAGYGELCVLCVFEREDDFAGEPGIDFMDPADIYQCRPVDAEELGGIKAALKIGDSLIDTMAASIDDREGELVVGDEVRDFVKGEK